VAVRRSDGSNCEDLRSCSDEDLIREGGLIGETQEYVRSVHFRDGLQS
jgi:hypothetical protein